VPALQKIQSHGTTDDALSCARALIETGQRRTRFPADHQGFVPFVVASNLLHRLLNTQPAAKSVLVEPYYLLGITETAISRTFWLSEAPFLLKTAIRLDPTSAVAAKADVATMQTSGVRRIYTYNRQHFTPFSDIEVLTP